MAQNPPIIDHTRSGVPLTSTLRDSVAAETVAAAANPSRTIAPRAAARPAVAEIRSVLCLVMVVPCRVILIRALPALPTKWLEGASRARQIALSAMAVPYRRAPPTGQFTE